MRRSPIARLLLVALAPPLAAIAGCTMTEGGYERLARSARAHNDRARAAAERELASRGYTRVVDTEAFSVFLPEPSRERCLAPLLGLDAGATPGERDAPLRVSVLAPPGELTREVSAMPTEVCAFFGGQRSELDVKRPDGSPARLFRTDGPRPLARDAKGELVVVDERPNVISSRVVRVKRTCNLMPSITPSPLDHAIGVSVRWAPEPKLRHVTLSYDYEALEVDCSDKVY